MLCPGGFNGREPGGRNNCAAQGIAGTVVQTRKSLLVNEYRTSPHAHPLTLKHTAITASIGEPLVFHERVIGALTLGHEGGRTFASQDQESLRLFATQAAIAITNARLHAAAVRRGAELEALLKASRSVIDRKSTRLNSSHVLRSRMPSSA